MKIPFEVEILKDIKKELSIGIYDLDEMVMQVV